MDDRSCLSSTLEGFNCELMVSDTVSVHWTMLPAGALAGETVTLAIQVC